MMENTKTNIALYISKLAATILSLYKKIRPTKDDECLDRKKEKARIKELQESKKIIAKFIHNISGLKSLLVTFKNQHNKQNAETILKYIKKCQRHIEINKKQLEVGMDIGESAKILDAMAGVERTILNFMDKSANLYSANDINYEIKIVDDLYHQCHQSLDKR
jgi:Mg2+ and Co2+ transporter CorA